MTDGGDPFLAPGRTEASFSSEAGERVGTSWASGKGREGRDWSGLVPFSLRTLSWNPALRGRARASSVDPGKQRGRAWVRLRLWLPSQALISLRALPPTPDAEFLSERPSLTP